jgi:hypothetical protein
LAKKAVVCGNWRTEALANLKCVDYSALVNDLLKKDIELIELGR